ncbi:MAG TPA: hypothetical protein VEX18_10720 [Polyangiaceae bacterium]|nr:hypothetical protein [Polyangiaceae bacterium]
MGLALSFFTRAALAARPPNERFGERGQLAIDQSFSMMASYDSSKSPGLEGLTRSNLRLAPTVSWFVLPQFAVLLGATVTASRSSSDEISDLGGHAALGGRTGLGYAVPLAEHFSFWPHASAGLTNYWFDSGDQPSAGPDSMLDLGVGVAAPVLWHPAPHFFLGLGPAAFAHYSGPRLGSLKHGFTALGVTSAVGGYFSL